MKIGKNWRVLKQSAVLRWAFLFYKHDCCNFDVPINLSQFLLTTFHQVILFTSQTETPNVMGLEWSVLDLFWGGFHVFITIKSGEGVKVMVPSQSTRMPWRHNNQPVIVIVVNIQNINWTYNKCYCYLFRFQNITFLVTLCVELRFLPWKCPWKNYSLGILLVC